MAGRRVWKLGDIMMKQSLAIVDPAVEAYEAGKEAAEKGAHEQIQRIFEGEVSCTL